MRININMPWIIIIVAIVLVIVIVYNAFKTRIPKGTSIKGKLRNSKVEFIYDLTYKQNKSIVYDQNIFSKIKDMIKDAQE
ncbi:MAG: hypothetical protein GX947_10230, partial [Tissierellia bacterium]|nr:hypothetical protein [Tissierellia bacterium]